MSFRAERRWITPKHKRHSAKHVDNRRVVGSVTIQARDRQEAKFLSLQSSCVTAGVSKYKGRGFLTIPMESLILAQDKRWRRA